MRSSLHDKVASVVAPNFDAIAHEQWLNRGSGPVTVQSTGNPQIRAFTGWKLDILDSICRDRIVLASHFRVAYALMQHVNSRSRTTHVSERKLAEECGVQERTVRTAIQQLIKKGYVHRRRPNRSKTNIYWFSKPPLD
jgi:hypothetical protein